VYLVIVFLSVILSMLLLSSKLKRNLIIDQKLTTFQQFTFIVGFIYHDNAISSISLIIYLMASHALISSCHNLNLTLEFVLHSIGLISTNVNSVL
jgi:hypothetical protein